MKPSLLKSKNKDIGKLYSKSNSTPFDQVYLNSREEYFWTCVKCSELFKKRPSLIHEGKTSCSKCVRSAQSKGRSLASVRKYGSIESLPEEIKSEWVDKIPMSEVSINSKKSYSWRCNYCETYYQKSPYKAVLIPGCLSCRRVKLAEIKRESKALLEGSFLDAFPEIAAEWDYEKNSKTPEKFTKYSIIEIWWICSKCSFSYKAPISRRSYGKTGCPPCGRSSRLERTVKEFLDLLKLKIVINSYPISYIETGVTKKRRLQIDILIPELNLGFEIQDFATHSKKFDFEKAKFRGGEIIKKGPIYHENKRKLAKEQLDITLIDLWEDDIESGKYKEIILEKMSKVKGEDYG